MHFNVAQLLQEPSGSKRSCEFNEDLFHFDGDSTVPVWGNVEMLRTDESIWIGVSLDSSIPSECSRCLKELTQKIHVEFDEEYFSRYLGYTEDRGLDEIDESQHIDYDNILDISDAVHQYLLTAVPMKPMCRDDCAGLCVVCGTDLNNSTCVCAKSKIDPRWAALKNFTTVLPETRNLSEN